MTLPVPTQSTWTVGQIATAALMNKNVRDSVGFLANPPLYIGVQQTAQSLPNTTPTPVTFDSELVDTYNGHSASTNTSRYTAAVPGWYLVGGKVNFGSNTSAGQRGFEVAVNGTVQNPSQVNLPIAAAFVSPPGASVPVFLNAGDYVELYAFQTTGGAITTSAGYSEMSVLWVHA